MLTHPSFWWSFGLPFQFLAQCLPDEVYRWQHHTEKHWDTGGNPYHERRFSISVSSDQGESWCYYLRIVQGFTVDPWWANPGYFNGMHRSPWQNCQRTLTGDGQVWYSQIRRWMLSRPSVVSQAFLLAPSLAGWNAALFLPRHWRIYGPTSQTSVQKCANVWVKTGQPMRQCPNG